MLNLGVCLFAGISTNFCYQDEVRGYYCLEGHTGIMVYYCLEGHTGIMVFPPFLFRKTHSHVGITGGGFYTLLCVYAGVSKLCW